MGWALHAFIEYDLSKKYGHAEKPFTGIVHCFAEVYLDQNYDLFGALGLTGPSGSPVSGTLGGYKEIVYRENLRPPLLPSRGIPYPISAMALGSIEMWVRDEDEKEKLITCDGLYWRRSSEGGEVLRQQAEQWVRDGKSRYLSNDNGIDNKAFISDPNCEFPSWLLLDELKKAVSAVGFSRRFPEQLAQAERSSWLKRIFKPLFHVDLQRSTRPQQVEHTDDIKISDEILTQLTELPWDYEQLILCMERIEEKIGKGRTRLFYWFEQ